MSAGATLRAMRPAGLAAAIVAGALGADPAEAWELVEEYEPVDGYLGDGQADTGRYPSRELYDAATGRHYAVFDIDVRDGYRLTVDVLSFDFQPVITVDQAGHGIVGQGTIEPTAYQQDGRAVQHARIDFEPPSPGPARLLVSGYVPGDRGAFKMEWTLWRPGGEAALRTPWEFVEEYQPVEGYLGDRQPDSRAYPSREIYDAASGRFYSVFELALADQRALVVDVYSFDFQPAITVQDKAHALIGQGTVQPGGNGAVFHARIEFHTPWEGPAELLVSSFEANRTGRFKMEWSLWREAPPSMGPGGVSTVAPADDGCDCQDPASGRRFQSPFEDLGECIPARAIKWCN